MPRNREDFIFYILLYNTSSLINARLFSVRSLFSLYFFPTPFIYSEYHDAHRFFILINVIFTSLTIYIHTSNVRINVDVERILSQERVERERERDRERKRERDSVINILQIYKNAFIFARASALL